MVDGSVKLSCLKDSDCESSEQCSEKECKNACLKHPCAVNAVCKVWILTLQCFGERKDLNDFIACINRQNSMCHFVRVPEDSSEIHSLNVFPLM